MRGNLQCFDRQPHEQKKYNLRTLQASRCSPVPIRNRDSRSYVTVLRRVPTKSTVSSQDTLFPENHSSALRKVIHESVEEESVWLGYGLVGSIKEGVN